MEAKPEKKKEDKTPQTIHEVPECPDCKIDMKIRKTIGGYSWYCPNYYKCGQFVKINTVKNMIEVSN